MSFLSSHVLGPAYRILNDLLGTVRRGQSQRIPTVELTARHIRNLRVVIDRQAFIKELPEGGVIAEVGVARGDLSDLILKLARPSQLHLIDIWGSKRYHEGLARLVKDRFATAIAKGQVHVHQGPSTEELQRFPDGFFDWIYIDTDHSFNLTRAELAIGMRKVKAGGILAGHDFTTANWDGGVRYGVVEAVHAFCVENDWELILLTHETDRHLSFAIRAIRQA